MIKSYGDELGTQSYGAVVEERKFVVQAVIHRVGVVKNLLPVGGEEAVFVARDVRRRLGEMVREILRDAH